MKGFTSQTLINLFKKRPANHDLVIKINSNLYVVKDIDDFSITVSEFSQLNTLKKEIKADIPKNIFYYWYFPLKNGKLNLYRHIDDLDEIENPKKDNKPTFPKKIQTSL
jgi:hypothetical protein